MLDIKQLPKTKDSKNKIRKSFNLSPKAVEIYEKARDAGIDSSAYVQNVIEECLLNIEHLVNKNPIK